MSARYNLNVQCFVKRNIKPVFTGENDPRLLYVSHVKPDHNSHPRILHSHEDHIEILLICGGGSHFLIHNRKYSLKAGDLVIYNSKIVHDDLTGPDTGITYYCVAVGGLHMPGLRENALISDEIGYVFPAGVHFGAMEEICRMMFDSLSHDENGAEPFCQSLTHALLLKAPTVTEENQGLADEALEDDDSLGNHIKHYIDSHYM